MMAKRKKITSKKPVTCIVIMILCLLSGIDDISGYWQPLNVTVPTIRSGGGQDDNEDHCVKVECNSAPWKDTIDVAQQLSFSQVYLKEIIWQVNLIYLNSSHNRAPPSFS